MGDPACFLSGTCLSCGRVLGPGEAEDDRCPHCGEHLDHLDLPTGIPGEIGPCVTPTR